MTSSLDIAAPREAQDPVQALEARASGSSFYMAMRLMPRAEREAMFAIYAFCRAVDDIVDDEAGSQESRRQALDAWRGDIARLYEGAPAGRAQFLAAPVAAFPLSKEDFLAVIDGMAMDLGEGIKAPSLDMLDLYCDRVASAVGRLSVKVFAMEEGPGRRLAQHLGRALQLTNILRDLDEDAGLGRLYLPREYLSEAGVDFSTAQSAIRDPHIDAACRSLARLAHAHFNEANQILYTARGKLRAPRLMAAVYSRLLAAMEKQGWAPPRVRVRLAKPALFLIVLRYGLFG